MSSKLQLDVCHLSVVAPSGERLRLKWRYGDSYLSALSVSTIKVLTFNFYIPLHQLCKESERVTAGCWYTDPSLQGKGEQCNSQVSHHRPCRGREPCHRLGQGKSGRQRGRVTDQMDKRGTLDQEDTDVHESGCRILPTQPHMGPGDFHVTCSIKL